MPGARGVALGPQVGCPPTVWLVTSRHQGPCDSRARPQGASGEPKLPVPTCSTRMKLHGDEAKNKLRPEEAEASGAATPHPLHSTRQPQHPVSPPPHAVSPRAARRSEPRAARVLSDVTPQPSRAVGT